MELVLLDKQDRIGTLTLNRPEKLNAMNPALLDEFSEAIASVSADEEIKVLVIRGAGRAFSAGYDLAGGGGAKTVDADRTALQHMIERWLSLRELPKPVIAMVHGYCLAGASQICVCSDVIFMADNARLGFPSLPAGAGFVSSMWNWMVGPHRTKYMAFFAGQSDQRQRGRSHGLCHPDVFRPRPWKPKPINTPGGWPRCRPKSCGWKSWPSTAPWTCKAFGLRSWPAPSTTPFFTSARATTRFGVSEKNAGCAALSSGTRSSRNTRATLISGEAHVRSDR